MFPVTQNLNATDRDRLLIFALLDPVLDQNSG
jgi:hypothetical protein